MEHQPLVIIGSARKDGNTSHFVDQVFKNIKHKKIYLLDYSIAAYNYENIYPENDQFDNILVEMLAFKTIIFATPVYWYAMSGLMKILFDRLDDLVTVRKEIGRAFEGKTTSIIISGTDPELPDGFETPFKLTSNYMKMEYKHRIYFTEDEKELGEKKQHELNLFLSNLP